MSRVGNLGDEGCKSAKSGEDGTDDDEMDVRGVAERLGAQCGFVQSFGVEAVAEVVRRGRLRWFGHV